MARTCIPEVVKYGISNFTCIGGFPSVSSPITLGKPKCALIRYSFPPGKDLIDHITADCSGAYLQCPKCIHIIITQLNKTTNFSFDRKNTEFPLNNVNINLSWS